MIHHQPLIRTARSMRARKSCPPRCSVEPPGGVTSTRTASRSTMVVVDEPRVKGSASTHPEAIRPDSGCRRSMISPVCWSYPPQNESGSEQASNSASPGDYRTGVDEFFHSRSSIITRPSIAERTQSSIPPKTTSRRSRPGMVLKSSRSRSKSWGRFDVVVRGIMSTSLPREEKY